MVMPRILCVLRMLHLEDRNHILSGGSVPMTVPAGMTSQGQLQQGIYILLPFLEGQHGSDAL
jgi:hypothetical protein